jgi:mono/diheme cytochrome c family protein
MRKMDVLATARISRRRAWLPEAHTALMREASMRSIVAVLCSLLTTPAIAAGQGQSPNGEAVYKQHCAACHEGTMPRIPSRETLKSVTPEAIETALSSFMMRRQGASLSAAERRAVAEFLSGRPAGSYRDPLDVLPKSAFLQRCRNNSRSASRASVERVGRRHA